MSKKLVILGAGESGTGTAVLAKAKGWDVFVSDMGKIAENYRQELKKIGVRWEEGTHTESEILSADEMVKSPGIPDKAPMVQAAMQKGIPVISEIEFAGRYTNAKMVCISGTNGKTTTTLLTHHILKNAGLNVGLGGNIGKSFARQVAEENHDIYVLEVSSFQLDGNFKFRSHISVLTNITPDHLDRYEYKLELYAASKFRLTRNQQSSDYFIYCADDPISRQYFGMKTGEATTLPISVTQTCNPGAYVENNTLFINNNKQTMTINMEEISLRGIHNTYNSMAAAVVASLLDVRKETIRESLCNFQNAEHRLEFVNRVNGVEYINDSKATNVNSAWYALESMDKPVVWIAGGVDKGNNYKELKSLVKEKVKYIICLGLDNIKIHQAFQDDVDMIINTGSAKEAVHVASRLAQKGDCVLLSPACASFDLFDNYEDRGRQFKEAVRNL
ncbi:MAG: UDP-N-acetylmuramoyl-L-alanine--D-glutamate ligase [Sphingomonadales bacterium]